MAIVEWLALTVPCVATVWSVAISGLAWLQPRSRPRRERTGAAAPGVTVLVPVSSPACGLASCVESIQHQTHRGPIEILLLAAVDDRAAVDAIRRAAEASPTVRALALSPRDAPNPKVGLLAAALAAARYDLLLFTDDNTVSPPDRIRRHLERRGEGNRLVSAAAIGVRPEGFWGCVDAAFMNGSFARLQLAGDRIGIGGVSGKSMLVARSDIERAGGLLPTGETLCEDAALQKRLARIGARTALSRVPVLQSVGRRTFGAVWSRHRRWFFCRRTQVPWAFVSEAVVCAASASAGAALGASALTVPWWLGAALAAGLLMAVEAAFLAAKGWPIGAGYPAVWIARETLVVPLWAMALLGGAVRWRGRRLALAGDRR